LVGGKLYSYAAGTTTPLVTYTDQAATSANTNPVILDSRGEASVWLGTGPYKLRLTTATDVDIWTVDDIYSEGAQSMQELLSASGSSLVGFIADGTGAAYRTVQSKLRDTVSVKDFGAVGDGTTDDTAAFNSARTAAIAAGVPLVIFGTPLISSQLTISSKEHWIFAGTVGNSSGSRPSSYLIKKSTVLGDFITVTAGNTKIVGGGLLGQTGNTGDGYVIKANGVILDTPYVEKMGQDGIRVGVDTPGSGINANSFLLIRPTSSINGRHGIYVSDGDATLPSNANAGTIIQPLTQNNGSDGIRIGNSSWTALFNPLSESNTGYGLYLAPLSAISVYGGDLEVNTAGDFYQADTQKNRVYDLDVGGFRYNSWMEANSLVSALAGSNQIQNPSFSTDTIWVKSSGTTIAANKVTIPAANSAIQRLNTINGATYRIRITIATAASRGILRVGSNGGGTFNLLNAGYISTSGSLEYSFTAVSENTWVQLLNDTGSSGSWEVSSVIVSAGVLTSGSLGFATGAGAAVTQATSRTTGVTVNAPCGAVTLVSAAGSATWQTFTVTNSNVAATDVVQVSQKSGTDKYMLQVTRVAAGAFDISFATTGGTTTEQPVFNFAVLKAVAS
jgi:hypothetical protein